MEDSTRAFLGQEYNWAQASLHLEDVQPMYGGVRVYLPRWTVGQLFVTKFLPGGQETKNRIPLGWREKGDLCQLFVEQDFLTIQPEERPGIPDEARPTITLTNSKDESHSVAKWAGVVDTRFDTLYHALLALAERTQDHKPIPARFNVWQKGLVISGLVLLLLFFLLLAYGLATILVTAWWPERMTLLFMVLFSLLIGTPLMLRGLFWWERNKSREDRMFSNPPVSLIFGLLFFIALICCANVAWAVLMAWWQGVPLATINDVRLSALIGYIALFSLYFVALGTMLIGSWLLDMVDARF